jgi:hypothetical protein
MKMTDDEYLKVYGVKPCLTELSRVQVTDKLSRELERKVLTRRNAWACWASEVKFTPDERRVDYVDFCPHSSISCCAAGAIERGTNWLGDANWLVCPVEMVEDMRQKQISVKVGVLAYGKHANGSQGFVRLREDMADWNGRTFRRHSAAEILYAMTRAGIRQGRAT